MGSVADQWKFERMTDIDPECRIATHVLTGVRIMVSPGGTTGVLSIGTLESLRSTHGDAFIQGEIRRLLSEVVLLPSVREERCPALLPDHRVVH